MKRLLACAAVALLSVVSAVAFEATVVSAKGKVEVLKDGNWLALAEGSVVNKGDVIQTGFKSELILKIKETVVTVDPLSRLTVEQLAEKSSQDSMRLFLDTGSLKSDVKKSENRRTEFTVRSPVATASVRGTVLTMRHRFRGTDVQTHEGLVAVWKNRELQEATLSTETEDREETESGTGNSAQDIASQAPKGAITVAAGQTGGATENDAAVSTPQTNAAKDVVNTNTSTERASAAESITLAATAATGITEHSSAVTQIAPTGTVVIKAFWEKSAGD